MTLSIIKDWALMSLVPEKGWQQWERIKNQPHGTNGELDWPEANIYTDFFIWKRWQISAMKCGAVWNSQFVTAHCEFKNSPSFKGNFCDGILRKNRLLSSKNGHQASLLLGEALIICSNGFGIKNYPQFVEKTDMLSYLGTKGNRRHMKKGISRLL